jgi:N-acetylglucosamine kinase-like BadF-type ATPase
MEHKMTKYFLGVDVGATKTHALITDESGSLLALGKAGRGNPSLIGYDKFGEVVLQAVNQALTQAQISMKQIAAAGFGVAGYDWASQREKTLNALDVLQIKTPREIVNDSVLGLLANARHGWGISLVAGTGCNCWGRNQRGEYGRVTGYGNELGEYAGGSELVDRATHLVAYEWTGRGQPTALTQAFIKKTGAKNLVDLIEGLSEKRYLLAADSAPLIFECAAQGDKAALDLLKWAGDELGELVIAVARQINVAHSSPDVFLIGGLFKGTPSLKSLVAEKVNSVIPKVTYLPMQAPPAVGAVILAMEQTKLQPYAIQNARVEMQIRAANFRL